MSNFTEEQIDFMSKVRVNTAAQQPSFVGQELGMPLLQAALISIDPEKTNEAGEVACQLTAAGMEILKQQPIEPQPLWPEAENGDQLAVFDPVASMSNLDGPSLDPGEGAETVVPSDKQPEIIPSPPAAKPVVENDTEHPVLSNVPLPIGETKKKASRKSRKGYPFESLKIGEAFFVAHSEVKAGGAENNQDAVRTMRSNANRANIANRVFKIDRVDPDGTKHYITKKNKDGSVKMKNDQVQYEEIQTKRFVVYEWKLKEPYNNHPVGTEGAMIFRVDLLPTDCHNCPVDESV